MTEHTTVLKNDISDFAYCMNVVEKAMAPFELTPLQIAACIGLSSS
jgi:hypothetical protein